MDVRSCTSSPHKCSTLSTETIDPFFVRWNKNPQTEFPEAIRSLETETSRPTSEKKRIHWSDSDVRKHEVVVPVRNRRGHNHPPETSRPWHPNPTPSLRHAELLCPAHQRRDAVSATSQTEHVMELIDAATHRYSPAGRATTIDVVLARPVSSLS
ncbi:hypothetical protein H4582DRAFT_2097986 [Lactarius indigo]|nr:hypothetical protein H4582DRAFT_2097986 [Lactarius indigo]